MEFIEYIYIYGRGQRKRHVREKKKKKKKLHWCLYTLFFYNSGSDHLAEGIVFAFTGWFNVHGGGANLLLLEACFDQMRHLGLLEIINGRGERRSA